MKSGLRDRNNTPAEAQAIVDRVVVSMKSGLRDRNNVAASTGFGGGRFASQ